MRLKNHEKRYNWRSLVACAKYELQVVHRRPGNVRPLTAEEDNLLLRLTYESFDHILRLAVEGSQEQLGRRVADPEKSQTEISDGIARSAPVRSSEAMSGGRKLATQTQSCAVGCGWGAEVRARRTAPCLGSPRQRAVAERRRALIQYLH